MDMMRLTEICPQCHRGVDGSSARLVSDVCGHPKCRICLLQEINGCLKCASGSGQKTGNDPPPRKSVIMSTLELKNDPQDHSTTRQVIHQSMQNDILFPTDIVKRSTGNFFHLKRLISERYLKEGGGKEDVSSKTEKKDIISEKSSNQQKLPSHIVHFCAVHKKTLTDKSAVERHKMCFDDVTQKFACDFCDKKFLLAHKLDRHRRSHQPTPRFCCSICSKSFKDNYALTTHKRIHTGQKAFTCNICDTQLKQLWSLKRHLAAHKGEKPFRCHNCSFSFYTKAELKRHITSHSNTKAYGCETCGARFSCHRSMVRHTSAHREVTPLTCRHCGVLFRRKDNLLRHEKNTHHTAPNFPGQQEETKDT